MNPFDYLVEEPVFETRLVGATSQRSHYEVSFPAPYQTDTREGKLVYADYFTPLSTTAPLLIISHGYGDESVAPCLTLARLLVRNGIAALVLYLPFHSRRLPAILQGKLQSLDSRAWFEYNRRAIIEIRRAVDWAYTRTEIVHDEVGVVGISLGGMISAIAMAVDERIGEGVLIAIGGNLEMLGWEGKGAIKPVGHACSREECRAVYSQYPEYRRKVAEKGVENVVPAKECFLIDPLTFARFLHGRPLLMINGRDDEIVPEQSTLALWEAYGRPKLVWLTGSHTGTYSQSGVICQETISFLNNLNRS
jgi:pimeloyl-ACP methyl ester carboxylesterase